MTSIRKMQGEGGNSSTLLFYSELLKPQLEHFVQFWTPHFRKDVGKLG